MSEGTEDKRKHILAKLKESQLELKKSIEEKTQMCGELCIAIRSLPDSILKETLFRQVDDCIVHVHTLMQHNKKLEVELTEMQNSVGLRK